MSSLALGCRAHGVPGLAGGRRRCLRRPDARRSCAKISASVSAIRVLKRRWVLVQPSHRCSGGSTDSGLSEKASTSPSSSRSRVRVGPRSSPNTARRMISSVSACSRGCRATASPAGQALDLAFADLGHHPAQALHPLAVEGGQEQPALREVDVLVEQDDRVAPDDRGQDRRALARMDGVGGGGEQRLDVGRIRQDHERRLEGELDRHPPAVAAQALERGGRARPGPQQLQAARDPRSRRQRGSQISSHRPLPGRSCRESLCDSGHELRAPASIAA